MALFAVLTTLGASKPLNTPPKTNDVPTYAIDSSVVARGLYACLTGSVAPTSTPAAAPPFNALVANDIPPTNGTGI